MQEALPETHGTALAQFEARSAKDGRAQIADALAAYFVARNLMLFNQRHVQATPRKQRPRQAPGGACADDEDSLCHDGESQFRKLRTYFHCGITHSAIWYFA